MKKLQMHQMRIIQESHIINLFNMKTLIFILILEQQTVLFLNGMSLLKNLIAILRMVYVLQKKLYLIKQLKVYLKMKICLMLHLKQKQKLHQKIMLKKKLKLKQKLKFNLMVEVQLQNGWMMDQMNGLKKMQKKLKLKLIPGKKKNKLKKRNWMMLQLKLKNLQTIGMDHKIQSLFQSNLNNQNLNKKK